MTALPEGTRVRVAHPTGGVRREDEFVVVLPPEREPRGLRPSFIWVRYAGPPDDRLFTREGARPMGFAPRSLEVLGPEAERDARRRRRELREAEVRLLLPDGWRVEHREEERAALRQSQVLFEVLDPEGEERTTVSVRYSAQEDYWWVKPGSTTSKIEGAEARARGVALLLAAEELDARQAAGTPEWAR